MRLVFKNNNHLIPPRMKSVLKSCAIWVSQDNKQLRHLKFVMETRSKLQTICLWEDSVSEYKLLNEVLIVDSFSL